MRIAVGQLDARHGSTPEGRRTALEAALDAVEQARAAGADLLVLPEYAPGWEARPVAALAEAENGPYLTALREAAQGMALVVGLVLPAAGGRARNVTAVLQGAGAAADVVGRYAKVHLYDAYGARESDLFDAGDPSGDGAPLVIEVSAGGGDPVRVGVMTCYDLRFPEAARALTDGAGGCDVIALGAAWAAGEGKAEQLRTLVRARAIENTAYVALASQAGRGRVGGSCVVDPRGRVLAEVGPGSDAGCVGAPGDDVAPGAASLAIADVDLEDLAAVREVSPVLAHRRYRVVPRES